MNDSITITVPDNPYPMTKPEPDLVWERGQYTKPYFRWNWPDAYKTWRVKARIAAKEAMVLHPRPIYGVLAVHAVFYWGRPKNHYSPTGSVKDHFKETCPQQWPLNHELLRGAIDALAGVVFDSITDIVQLQSDKLWADEGSSVITVRQISPRDVDPAIRALPEQLDLFNQE